MKHTSRFLLAIFLMFAAGSFPPARKTTLCRTALKATVEAPAAETGAKAMEMKAEMTETTRTKA